MWGTTEKIEKAESSHSLLCFFGKPFFYKSHFVDDFHCMWQNNIEVRLIKKLHAIKTTLRFHSISVKIAKINKINDSSYRSGCEEWLGGTFIHCAWVCKRIKPL